MKMVSQLTRQAMRRHRIISLHTPAAAPVPTPAAPAAVSAAASPVRPLYTPPAPAANPLPERRQTAPAPPQTRPRTIYQQLMVSHDRMRERHVLRT